MNKEYLVAFNFLRKNCDVFTTSEVPQYCSWKIVITCAKNTEKNKNSMEF